MVNKLPQAKEEAELGFDGHIQYIIRGDLKWPVLLPLRMVMLM